MKLTAVRLSVWLTAGCLLLYLTTVQTSVVRTLEAKFLDLRLQWRGPQVPSTPLAIISIDDKSLVELGRWPWSRVRFARIVQQLHAAGARVIAFDMLFLEPELSTTQTTLSQVREAFAGLPGVPTDLPWQQFAQFLRTLIEESDADHQFAMAVRQAGNVVLPFAFATASTRLRERRRSLPPR